MQRAFSVWPLLLVLLGGAALAVCQWLIFFYAPVEAQLGLMQKVFYTHLPLAWWALISFLVVFVASIVYLIRRSPAADRVCAAAAEVGVLLAGLALVTGMIWARRSWGVWWTWDPRLTTTLVMWFIYAGYLVLRGLDLPPQRKRMICAVVGVVAFLDVPLVFLSARLWRSIHPAVFASKGGGLEPEDEADRHRLCGGHGPVLGGPGVAAHPPAGPARPAGQPAPAGGRLIFGPRPVPSAACGGMTAADAPLPGSGQAEPCSVRAR